MKNPNVSRFGVIEGRMHRDPDTGMLNVDWSDGHREVYMALSALRAAGPGKRGMMQINRRLT